jgi:hypothetical protein
MKRPYVLMSLAWLVHAVAWCLPVVKNGVVLPEGLPGWEAFRVASSAVWRYRGDNYFIAWHDQVLSTISALTTVLFVAGSPWVMWRGSPFLRRASAWVAATSFIVNVYWFISFGQNRSNLRVGYYMWWLSFALLAIGLFYLARLRHRDRSLQT